MRPNAVPADLDTAALSRKVKGERLHRIDLLGLIDLSLFSFHFSLCRAQNNEREQQFAYYYYAAHAAIEDADYVRAFVLLDFCEQLNPQDGRTKEQLGIIYDALGDTVKAAQLFAEAYRYAPDDCWQNYSKFMMRTYLRDGKWRKALKLQDRIDARQGYDANSALMRYRIYTQWGKGNKAVQAVDDYIAYDPTSLYFLLFRADIALRAERPLEAFNLCLKMAKLFPLSMEEFQAVKQNPYCAYYLSHIKSYEGDSLAHIGEIKRCFETYEQALFLSPQDPYIMNNYAYLMAIHGGDLIRAEQMSAACIKAEPNNPYYLDTYGWILHLRGQDSLALFYLRKAFENSTDLEAQGIIKEHIHAIAKP